MDAVDRRGRCALLLSGGGTPRAAYELLATRYRDRVPWAHVHLFWGDERFVPPDDPRSNYRMAREALVDHVPCPPAHVHPVPTGLSSADVASHR
jgi:6-phosphogluconolactonase